MQQTRFHLPATELGSKEAKIHEAKVVEEEEEEDEEEEEEEEEEEGEEEATRRLTARHNRHHHHHHGHTRRNLPEASPPPPSTKFCSNLIIIFALVIVGVTFPFSLLFCMKIVAEYERAVILRLGRCEHDGAKGPGLFFIVPCVDHIRKVDLRTLTFDVPPQEVLTKDSVTVAVDAVVYYRIFNPVVSVINVADADRSTRLLAQTTLRNVLGTKNLSDILMEREEISALMQENLDSATDPWGVMVERVEIKDVRLPVMLQRAMAAEAEAAREARAKSIAADGERNASRALRDAADVLCCSPYALQLRYLQTMSAISAEKNSTIVFPMPIDMLPNVDQRVGPTTSPSTLSTATSASGHGSKEMKI